jgi:hypothetical protein
MTIDCDDKGRREKTKMEKRRRRGKGSPSSLMDLRPSDDVV